MNAAPRAGTAPRGGRPFAASPPAAGCRSKSPRAASARGPVQPSLDPRVVGRHGWWQACPEPGLPGCAPFSPEGTNLNLLVGGEGLDPPSGTPPALADMGEIQKSRLTRHRRLEANGP